MNWPSTAVEDGFRCVTFADFSRLECPCGASFRWEGISDAMEPWKAHHRAHLGDGVATRLRKGSITQSELVEIGCKAIDALPRLVDATADLGKDAELVLVVMRVQFLCRELGAEAVNVAGVIAATAIEARPKDT